MFPKLSTAIAIKGGERCKKIKRQGFKRVPAVKKPMAIVNMSILIGNMSTHILKLKKEVTALCRWIWGG